jgi:hypothetical protein
MVGRLETGRLIEAIGPGSEHRGRIGEIASRFGPV